MASITSKHLISNITALSALAALCWAPEAKAQNLLSNGTFDEDISPWWEHAADDLSQSADAVEGAMCSVIDAAGENPWDIIVGYSGVELLAGQYYHISLSAWADVPRPIRFKTGLGDAPYSDYFLKEVDLTTTPQVFDFTYLNLRADDSAQFQFQIGGMNSTVCFDDIVLEPVAAPVAVPYVSPSQTGHTLRDYSGVIKIGTAVDTPTFLSSPVHNNILAGEFNMLTPANAMKMNIIQATQGVFDWAESDALLAFADTNGMDFHGHPLVWHTQAASWLEDPEVVWDRDSMIQVMYAHIDALVGRYVGRIPYWDVVNEAIERQDDGSWGFRPTIWHDRIGDDFIDLAFQRAAAADPNAQLLYNDYNIAVMGNPKADKVFEMVSDMVTRGIPIHQIGMQNHWYVTPDGGTSGLPDPAMIRANMDRYAAIGIGVQVTEFDVRIGVPLDDQKSQMQAQVFADVLRVCIEAPNCNHLTVWGISDYDSWVPSTFDEYDFAHIFDRDFVAKPAYHSMTQVLSYYPADGAAPVPTMAPTGMMMPMPGVMPASSSDGGGCAVATPARGSNAWLFLVSLMGLGWCSRRRSRRA